MHLLVLSNSDRSRRREIPLADQPLTIGSGEGNRIRLRHDAIAARQCSIVPVRDGRYKLVDEHTDAGTCVNGSFVAQRLLVSGDVVELGDYRITYEVREAAAAVVAQPQATTPALPARAGFQEPAAEFAVPAQSLAAGPEREPRSSRGPHRTPSASARLLRSVLFAATAMLAVFALAELLPAVLERESFAGTYAQDRFDLARVLRDGGELARARTVLRQLALEEPGTAIEDELRRIDSLETKGHHAKELLAHLLNDPGLEVDARLAQARELQQEYGDVPVIGVDISRQVDLLTQQSRIAKAQAVQSLDSLQQVSDGFVEDRNYLAAHNVWARLSETGLLVDASLRQAEEQAIEAAAGVAAERLLASADALGAKGDALGAMNVLNEDAVLRFRGTTSFTALEAFAQQLEEAARTQEQSGSLVRSPLVVRRPPPAQMPPPAVRAVAQAEPPAPGPAPVPTVDDRAGRAEPPPRTPSSPVASGPTVTPIRPAAGGRGGAPGDEAFARGALGEALAACEAALAQARSADDQQQLSRRIERAQRARWFLDTLCHQIEADPVKVGAVSLRFRSGREPASVVGVEDRLLRVQAKDGDAIAMVDPEDLDTASAQALARRYKLSEEDHLNRAFYLLIDGEAADLDEALLASNTAASLKAAHDSVVAFMRGDAEPPEWGYFRHEGRWLSFRERERAENLAALKVSFKQLDKSAHPDAKEYQTALEEIRALVPVSRDDLAPLLRERRSAQVKALGEMPELAAVDKVFEQRRLLEERRLAALGLIYDTVRYFYPYADRPAEYASVQNEVDELVQQVREVWGNENADPEGGVALSRKFQDLRQQIAREGEILALVEQAPLAADPLLERVALLPMDAGRVNVRNIAIDAKERQRLDRDSQVLANNAKGGTSAAQPEAEQVHITNMYRLMMGRQAVAINDLLCKSARGHATWMSRTGKFQHDNDEDPNLRSPGDRIRAQGYVAGGSGENIAINGSASGAHAAWIHSSGHHRNLLLDSHRELGVGGVGRYWVQNFAGGGDYAGNLGDL